MALTARGDAGQTGAAAGAPAGTTTRRGLNALVRFVRRKPLAAAGGLIVAAMLIMGAFAPIIAPYGYDDRDYSALLENPSAGHLLGTDNVGRDIFSRIVYGARVSIVVGFGAVAISMALATLLGVPAGYFGGKLDLVLQRVVDIWMSFPGLLLLIVFASVFRTPTRPTDIVPGPAHFTLEPSEIRTLQIVLALGVILAGGTSRVLRSVVIGFRHNQFMEAAHALGAGHPHIIRRYVLPNAMPTMLVIATVQLGVAILIEASLSFLQFGIPPPVPAWGSMLSDNAIQFVNRAPLLAVWPGLAISLAVFGFNMLGDGLRDVLDPRMRGGR